MNNSTFIPDKTKHAGGNPFMIVGIGASSGSIQILKEFFLNLPETSSIAYVVILPHLPGETDRFVESLQALAKIPVSKVVSVIQVEPDHVYVIPPGTDLSMVDRQIIVTKKILIEEKKATPDANFKSLAESTASVSVKEIKIKTATGFELINIFVKTALDHNSNIKDHLPVFKRIANQYDSNEVFEVMGDKPLAKQLQEEIIQMINQLKTSEEKNDLDAKDIKTSNEAFQAMNEELHTSAEELERSKEELVTVNRELKKKIKELSLFSNNLQNLVNSANIATIFLDGSFRIALFTPACSELFDLTSSSTGKLISGINNKLIDNRLVHQATFVLQKLQTIEEEVSTTDGKFYIMRMMPYRTKEVDTSGVVINFIDITERRHTQQMIERDLDDTRLLHELSVKLSMETDMQVIYNAVMETAITLTRADAGTMQLFDGTTQELVMKASRGFSEEMTTYYARVNAASATSCGIALSTAKRSLVKYDVPLNEDPDGSLRMHAAAGYNYGQSTPLVTRSGKPIGMVSTHWYTNHTIGERESHLLNLLAIQSANILEQRYAEEALRNSEAMLAEELADTKQLQQVSSMLVQEGGLDAFHENILHAAIALMGSDMASLQLYDHDKNRLQLIAYSGFNEASAVYWQWIDAASSSICAAALNENKRIIIPDVLNCDYVKKEVDLIPYKLSGIRAVLSTPLISRTGTLLGMLSTHWTKVNTPKERSLHRFEILARQVADLAEHKLSVEALRLSEERNRIALQAAEMAAWQWNITDNTVEWNDQHYLLLGLEPSGGKKDTSFFVEMLHPDDRAMVLHRMETAAKNGTVYHAEFRIKRADNGEVRWMNGYGKVFKNIDTNTEQMLGVMYDITESKKMELQKDEFIGIASHELKTPVTSIKAYTDLLQQIHANTPDNQTGMFVNKLGKQVDRLTELIRSLLDTTKISEGQLQMHFEKVDMNELVAEHAEEQQRLTALHKIVFTPGDIQPVKGDRERLGQVVNNIISNAVKYSPKGGRIDIGTSIKETGVKVNVRDYGVGIPEELKSKVFDRFFRVTNPGIHTYPGLGLGLYISAGIIRRHGGIIGLESKINNGSCFYFILPSAENE